MRKSAERNESYKNQDTYRSENARTRNRILVDFLLFKEDMLI